MHLHGLDLSAQLVGGESDDHAGLDNSGLNTAHWNCSNASNFVNILRTSTMSNIGRLLIFIPGEIFVVDILRDSNSSKINLGRSGQHLWLTLEIIHADQKT